MCLAARLLRITGAAKTNTVIALLGIGVHSFGAGQPIRLIVPAAAAQHFAGTAAWPPGVAPVRGWEAFREPIRHPLPGIARHILYAERTGAFRMAADSSDTVLVNRALGLLRKARKL